MWPTCFCIFELSHQQVKWLPTSRWPLMPPDHSKKRFHVVTTHTLPPQHSTTPPHNTIKWYWNKCCCNQYTCLSTQEIQPETAPLHWKPAHHQGVPGEHHGECIWQFRWSFLLLSMCCVNLLACQVLLGRTAAPQHCTRTPESFDHKVWLLIVGSGITIPSLCSTLQPCGPMVAGHKICTSTVIYFGDCQWNSHFCQCKMGSPPGMGLQWSSQTGQSPDICRQAAWVQGTNTFGLWFYWLHNLTHLQACLPRRVSIHWVQKVPWNEVPRHGDS